MANPLLDLSKVIKKVVKLVGDDVVSRKVLLQLGKLSAERISKRTRLGYGVRKSGAKRERLKNMRKHSPAYTLFRKRSSGSLSSFTSATRVNLTLSGEMLGDIVTKNVLVNKKTVILGFKSRDSKIKAEVNEQRGWKFMNLSDVEIKALRNSYQRIVRKLAKGAS